MTKTALLNALALLALAAAPAAQAGSLLDTGTPTGSQPALAVDSVDFIALQFHAADRWQIEAVSAYLTGGSDGDQAAISLYTDNGGRPGDLVASTTFTVAADGWNGGNALGWVLPAAGDYWLGVEGVTLESPAGSGIFVPQGSFLAPGGGNSLPGLTAFSSDGSSYTALAGLQFGVQVTGVVPEPAAAWLLLAGLGGLAAGSARRRPAA